MTITPEDIERELHRLYGPRWRWTRKITSPRVEIHAREVELRRIEEAYARVEARVRLAVLRAEAARLEGELGD